MNDLLNTTCSSSRQLSDFGLTTRSEPMVAATIAEFDAETDAGIERIDCALKELAVTRCPRNRRALAASLAAGLCKSMMMSEEMLYGSLLHSHPR